MKQVWVVLVSGLFACAAEATEYFVDDDNCGNIDNQSGAVYTTDDPKFKDLAGGDYHVREDSPAIDAFDGTEVWSKIWNYIDTDYDGNPVRIVNGYGTCGCYQTDFFPRLGLILIFK